MFEKSFFVLHADSSIADRQLQILKHIAALPMSSSESKIIKPLVEMTENLLKEWIILDRSLKDDEYALKKLLVIWLFWRVNIII